LDFSLFPLVSPLVELPLVLPTSEPSLELVLDEERVAEEDSRPSLDFVADATTRFSSARGS
jgi:hypothetical protein